MNKREFKEDLSIVLLMYYPYTSRTIKFPLNMPDSFLETSIMTLELSKRSENVLRRSGVNTIKELIDNFDNLGSFRNCGAGSVKELRNIVLSTYYKTLDDKGIKRFWKEFIEENKWDKTNKKKK